MNTMRAISYGLCFCTFLLAISTSFAQLDLPRGSGAASVSQTIGLTTVSIHYSRPNVVLNEKDRTGEIWGKVVPYKMDANNFTGQPIPWRAGANENTIIELSTDVKIEGKDLAAGTYSFHIIPYENGEATLIFNRNTHLWGSFGYDESEDVLRVDIKTMEAPKANLLTFDFTEVTKESCILALTWELKRFPFKIETATHEVVIASLDRQLGQSLGFQWTSYVTAANYCLNNDTHLEKGLTWINTGINFFGGNFQLFNTKANLLDQLEKAEEAEKFRQMALGSGNITDLYLYGQQLMGKKQIEEALAVFVKNEERFNNLDAKGPMDAFIVYMGLAVGYNANENKEMAISYAKKAAEAAPTPPTKARAEAMAIQFGEE